MASCRAIQVFEQKSEIKAFHARHIAHGHEPRERSRIGVSTSSGAKHLSGLRPTPDNVGHFHVTGDCLHAMSSIGWSWSTPLTLLALNSLMPATLPSAGRSPLGRCTRDSGVHPDLCCACHVRSRHRVGWRAERQAWHALAEISDRRQATYSEADDAWA